MSKKLTAVLLTLCMVLGMLPMTALAAWEYDGESYDTLPDYIDVDSVRYYQKSGTYSEGDNVEYYSSKNANDKITLVWVDDVETEAVLEGTTAKIPEAKVAQVVEDIKDTKGNIDLDFTPKNPTTDISTLPSAAIEVPKAVIAALEEVLTVGSGKTANIFFPKGGILVDENNIGDLADAGGDITLTVNTAGTDLPTTDQAVNLIKSLPGGDQNPQVNKVINVDLKAGAKAFSYSSPLQHKITVAVNISGLAENTNTVWYLGGEKFETYKATYDDEVLSWDTFHFCDLGVGYSANPSAAEPQTPPAGGGEDTVPVQKLETVSGKGLGDTYEITVESGMLLYQITHSGVNAYTLLENPDQTVKITVNKGDTVRVWIADSIFWTETVTPPYFNSTNITAKWSTVASEVTAS